MPTTLEPIEPLPASLLADWRPVDPEMLPENWPQYRPFIQRAIALGEGSYYERDMMAALLTGAWQLYAHDDPATSVAILEIVNFPRNRKCLVRYVVGDGEAMEAGLPVLERIARERGCTVIEAYARNGWVKRLPDWKQKYVILQKEL